MDSAFGEARRRRALRHPARCRFIWRRGRGMGETSGRTNKTDRIDKFLWEDEEVGYPSATPRCELCGGARAAVSSDGSSSCCTLNTVRPMDGSVILLRVYQAPAIGSRSENPSAGTRVLAILFRRFYEVPGIGLPPLYPAIIIITRVICISPRDSKKKIQSA